MIATWIHSISNFSVFLLNSLRLAHLCLHGVRFFSDLELFAKCYVLYVIRGAFPDKFCLLAHVKFPVIFVFVW